MRNRGFTLLELLVVIAVITILVGLLSPVLDKVREQAKIKEAEAMVASLELAINMYYTDIGEYPAILGQLREPGDSTYGPYIDDKHFDGTNFIDPWGKPYQYNPTTHEVYSCGPDKEPGGDDDIT